MVARFGGGGLLQGGMNTGRTRKQCVGGDNNGNPIQYCKNVPPFWHPQIKFSGVYPVPFYDLQLSATLQNLPGAEIRASRVFTNAVIKPSLGRDLSAGPNGVKVVNMIEPNTVFEDRLTQLDIRFTKIFRLGGARLQGQFGHLQHPQ